MGMKISRVATACDMWAITSFKSFVMQHTSLSFELIDCTLTFQFIFSVIYVPKSVDFNL